MNIPIPSNKKPFRLFVTIRTRSPQRMRIVAKDAKKYKTYYINRSPMVNGEKTFVLKFPQSPEMMKLSIFNKAYGNYEMDEDRSFEITQFKPDKLVTCSIWTSPQTRSFMEFAQWFSENASVLSAGKKYPSIYRSRDGQFTIDYYDIIRDNGVPITTPARVGHARGIMEVSKDAFLHYTVPERMIILLHEYSHKWMNPKIGREIGYETGADINGAYLYLAHGYPEIEMCRGFLAVFRNARTKENHKRYKIVVDFIEKFNQGQIVGSCDRNAA